MGSQRVVTVRVSGRVQGVGYREWTRREAEGLGVSGWVVNETDGSVNALLSGPAEAVATMIERMRQGPSHAIVDKVAVQDVDEPAPTGFRIAR